MIADLPCFQAYEKYFFIQCGYYNLVFAENSLAILFLSNESPSYTRWRYRDSKYQGHMLTGKIADAVTRPIVRGIGEWAVAKVTEQVQSRLTDYKHKNVEDALHLHDRSYSIHFSAISEIVFDIHRETSSVQLAIKLSDGSGRIFRRSKRVFRLDPFEDSNPLSLVESIKKSFSQANINYSTTGD